MARRKKNFFKIKLILLRFRHSGSEELILRVVRNRKLISAIRLLKLRACSDVLNFTTRPLECMDARKISITDQTTSNSKV